MKRSARITLAGLIGTGIFMFGAIVFRIPAAHGGDEVLPLIVAGVCGVITVWFVWKKTAALETVGPISFAVMGALLLGGMGFMAGFFGPMLLVPEANQGPMLGIFFTGPAGFFVGAIAGMIYWKIRTQKSVLNNPEQGS